MDNISHIIMQAGIKSGLHRQFKLGKVWSICTGLPAMEYLDRRLLMS